MLFAVAFGVRMSPAQVAGMLRPAWPAACSAGRSGLATHRRVPNQRSAMQVFQFLIIPQYVLGGVLVPLHGLRPLLGRHALGHAAALRRGTDAGGVLRRYTGLRPGGVGRSGCRRRRDGGLFVVLWSSGAPCSTYRERDPLSAQLSSTLGEHPVEGTRGSAGLRRARAAPSTRRPRTGRPTSARAPRDPSPCTGCSSRSRARAGSCTWPGRPGSAASVTVSHGSAWPSAIMQLPDRRRGRSGEEWPPPILLPRLPAAIQVQRCVRPRASNAWRG